MNIGKAINDRAPYDARQIANFILDNFNADRFEISSMKLLKILFFIYGWYAVRGGGQLFHNPIEAWRHGPVVKVVWSEFSSFGRAPIQGRAAYLDLATGGRAEAPPSLSNEDAEFVRQTTREYIEYTAWHMSEMTHADGSPWHQVWHSGAGSANLGMRISDVAIREYFLKRISSAITV